MLFSYIRFHHFDIHKTIWLSHDQSTWNWIDDVLVYGRHTSCIQDVHTIWEVNMDSYHYLLDLRLEFALPLPYLMVESLLLTSFNQHEAKAFANKASTLFTEYPSLSADNNLGLSILLHASCCGECTWLLSSLHNNCYDQKCRERFGAKDASYTDTLQPIAYNDSKREEKRNAFLNTKAYRWEKELEISCSKNDDGKISM